ncbi:MAG TPA: glycosyltransferase [Solirubrobacteraceae bacterium]|jgi:glycosyltransferase involved in cell wall biosynthesis|nr:glycosyltransferase [Solirubrobacteraceae bacterium]
MTLDPRPDRDEPHDYSEKLRQYLDEAPLERQSIVEFVAAAAASLPTGSLVLDVGAGSAPFRELFSHTDYVTVDRARSLHGAANDFDLVASADDIPLKQASVDAIVCTQVLEHLPEPVDALTEFFRLLKPGGVLFLTAPLVWEEHEKPDDYFRYTRSGLAHILEKVGFEHIEITGRGDCFSTLAQLLRNARWSLGEAENGSQQSRQAAFQRLDEIATELIEFAPLDSRQALPLGYQVVSTRPQKVINTQDADGIRPPSVAPIHDARPVPILYLAPWVDLGGSDKGTIDWFKHIDRSRWAPTIITTQPSDNRWLPALETYADEVWPLPNLMRGAEFPAFILGFIETRGIKIVHIMNSRLGFDLMPDMRCLAEPPVVVVQHHAEEHDRSGYVRYVASRYGNLVDAFSVTSQQLADAMTDYDVPYSRMQVIPTGVDGIDEFNPDSTVPLDLPTVPGSRILWPGRLAAQKDPMLTLDVVKLLADRGVIFSLHIVGDGEMKDEVMARASELDVSRLIYWHPPSHEMARWYRSSDILFMTSVFEGVPYVIYEALAMGIPVVAPALPGNIELMGTSGGILIDPRDDVDAYANAIQGLLCDDQRRRQIGTAARDRMLKDFSLSDMASRHEALYDDLILNRPTSVSHNSDVTIPEKGSTPYFDRVSFPRNPVPERTVAVIVPCFQHGRYLGEAIQSIREQTLPPKKVIVVDDASADPETTEALDKLDQNPTVTVIRLARNSGPSVARNRALAEVTENYILPVDADDMLLPTTIEEMVAQLESAPESVGFIYPNVQHFGNRHDFYRPPAYNLNLLLNNNFCAATSLFDSRVFAAGVRYAEDIVFGHEDWDLVLQMAERGIEGEAAEDAVFKYRKRGFSRVNAAEYGPRSFHDRISRRHPRLYGQRRDQIKATWAPALSLVLMNSRDAASDDKWDSIVESLQSQSCGDFETSCVGFTLNNTKDLCIQSSDGQLESLRTAIEGARGRFVVLANDKAIETIGRFTFVEQIIRLFWSDGELARVVLADVAGRKGPRLSLLTSDEATNAIPCAVAWRRSLGESYTVELGATPSAIEDILMQWHVDGPVEWRSI